MKARITNPQGFRCAPDGAVVVTYPYGTEVEGQVARWAVDMGNAAWLPEYDTKVTGPTETKPARGRKRSTKAS